MNSVFNEKAVHAVSVKDVLIKLGEIKIKC